MKRAETEKRKKKKKKATQGGGKKPVRGKDTFGGKPSATATEQDPTTFLFPK